MRFLGILVGLSLTALFCTAVAQEGIGHRAEEQQVQELGRQWVEAVTVGDIEAISSLYSSDSTLSPPSGPPVRGHEALREWWRGFLGQRGLSLQFGPAVFGVTDTGYLAYETGTYSLGFAEGAITDEGMYLQVWRKVEGEWQLVAGFFISSPATP